MIKNIIDLLQIVGGETENIRIAKGKNSLPKDLNSSIKHIKNSIKWR